MKKIKRFFRMLRKVIYTTAVISIFVLTVTVGVFAYKFMPVFEKYVEEADALVSESSAETFHPSCTSHVYASNGEEIAKLHLGADIDYVSYNDIPQDVINAFVSVEDKRYYQHHGVDWASTAKSFYLLVRTGDKSRGGSTITQQLVRNVFTEHVGFEKSYKRKIKEIITALCLEKRYSKKLILEYYINNINYGNNYYGIGAAAYGYFGKSVDTLSTAEVALLCAIPNNPSYYNPRTNLKHTVERRNIILREMYNQGKLDRKSFLEAVNSSVEIQNPEIDFHDYESSYAIKCAVEYLMQRSGFKLRYDFDTQTEYDSYREEYNNVYAEAEHMLYTGGYSVYTTIDLDVQKQVQKYVDKELAVFSDKDKDGVYKMQGAATVIDNAYGKVIACVGGRDPATSGYSFNRSYQAYMQPGSSIKPLIVYTPALQNGYTAETIVHDTAIEDGPKNSDGRYLGDITLRTAVEKSRNTVAWQLFDEMSPRKGLKFVQDMHFDKITPNDYYNPASLGGLYYGVNTIQMASGYATLANGGEYRTADCIKMIVDGKGNDIYTRDEPKRIYTTKASNQMLNILSGVSKTGTAAGLTLKDNRKMPLACKTGTTNGGRCAWFCGVTPYYSVAVYVGRDDNCKTQGLQGASYPMFIWRDVQNYLCKNKRVRSIYIKEVKKKKKKKPESTESSEQDSGVEVTDVNTRDSESEDTSSGGSSSNKPSQPANNEHDNDKPNSKPDIPKPEPGSESEFVSGSESEPEPETESEPGTETVIIPSTE